MKDAPAGVQAAKNVGGCMAKKCDVRYIAERCSASCMVGGTVLLLLRQIPCLVTDRKPGAQEGLAVVHTTERGAHLARC